MLSPKELDQFCELLENERGLDRDAVKDIAKREFGVELGNAAATSALNLFHEWRERLQESRLMASIVGAAQTGEDEGKPLAESAGVILSQKVLAASAQLTHNPQTDPDMEEYIKRLQRLVGMVKTLRESDIRLSDWKAGQEQRNKEAINAAKKGGLTESSIAEMEQALGMN